MKLRYITLTAALVLVLALTAVSQDRLTVKLVITNGSSTCADTFGIAPTATMGVDASLGEQDQPPAPPPGSLFAVFQGDAGLGVQTLAANYHPVVIAAQSTMDSFYLHFQRAADSLITVIHWNHAFLAKWMTSCQIVDVGWNLNPVDMLTVDSMVVPAGQPSRTNKVYFDWAIWPVWKAFGPDGVQQKNARPATFGLQQNYPNPFNPTTSMDFSIQKSSFTNISVYNILGQKVATLVDQQMNPGQFTTHWNGADDRGMAVSSGVYFVRMNATAAATGETFTQLRKLVLMK